MKLKTLSPRQSLNKAFLKEKISRSEFELLKSSLTQLFTKIDFEESEENSKTILRDFLNDIHFQDKHHINTLRDIDLVIYHENNQNKPAVLLEVKRPKNKPEMITKDNLNAKAMHELIRYFLEERIDFKNNEIKFLVVTNIKEWFIFDAALFESLFFKNKAFVKEYETWRDKQKVSGNTDLFYNEIAKPFLAALKDEIIFTYFNLEEHKKLIKKDDPESKKQLIAIYKILSPAHLLKKPFANDSNSLDRNFYTELLHIIGLVETKVKNKKIISRKPKEERNPGSIIENAIVIIETDNVLSRLKNVEKYGSDKEERLFNLALELSITWINRILFLKLLEAQLFKYHNDEKHKFLNKTAVKDFDELYKLFHQVLAIPVAERTEIINKKFGLVPYLNSSLFEISDLESETIKVNSLDDNTPLELFKNTILKDKFGKKRLESLPVLHYLYEFLDAYDFTSEGKEEIQEDKKILINASVLGLIFEKINGYKDGSFFTPGFITMYMCRETLSRSVVNKFNQKYSWSCESLTDLKNHLSLKRNSKDILEFNSVINSIKICDPAVGSGHFLVSALNELIAIKSELGLLADYHGEVLSGYFANVENDELIISCNNGEDIFEYHPPLTSGLLSRPQGRDRSFNIVQRVQETLFQEKQTIIENCLFGVDINPNSVKIARLRLWIELLKNAFYTKESRYTELETLPNIDINIKEGNSLISRFPLNADLKPALKTIRYTLEDYKNFVKDYKNTNDKEQKANFRKFIDDIKSNFRTEIGKTDPRQKKLNDLLYELHQKFRTERLFGNDDLTIKQKEKLKKEESDLEKKIEKLRNELNDERSNVIYNNSFEWRFEFPEVLDDDANFVGFDVVIGNPPYIRQEDFKHWKDYLSQAFSVYTGLSDLYVFFVEKSFQVLRDNGDFCFILPNKWMQTGYGKPLKSLILSNKLNSIIDFGDLQVFEEATTYPCILSISKDEPAVSFLSANIKSLKFSDSFQKYVKSISIEIDTNKISEETWIISSVHENNFLTRLNESFSNLDLYVGNNSYRGIVTGLTEAFVIDHSTKEHLIRSDLKIGSVIKPLLLGRDINPYSTPVVDKYLLYVPWHFPLQDDSTIYGNSSKAEKAFKEQYPAIFNHLYKFKAKLEKRNAAETGIRYEWYAMQRWASDYYLEFEKPKIMYQKFQVKPCFIYDEKGLFCNDSIWFLPTTDKVLLAILNSKMGWWLISKHCTAIQNGYQLIWDYLKQIPIATANKDQSKLIILLVDKIITAKENNPKYDSSIMEAEIDKLVYELYGLTEEEIKIVEGNQ